MPRSPLRCVLVASLVLLFAGAVRAQSPAVPATNVAPYAPYVPVTLGPVGSDPYARVGVQPTGWWMGNAFQIPTRESIRDRLWYRIEYLHWGSPGMDVPPLATTSPLGTPQSQAGVLGQAGTAILFGGNSINGDSVSGIRTRSGFVLSRARGFAIGSEYFELASQNDGFAAGSDGSVILARPFFDITSGGESSHLVSYPNDVGGNLLIGSRSKLRSIMISGRAGLCPTHGAMCEGCSEPDRVDWIVGYRFAELEDRLDFNENLTSLVPTAPGTREIAERFDTRNRFNGMQLGIVYLANFRRAWLESLIRVAIGGTNQRVRIQAGTTITESGTTNNFNGGILAQRTNIGEHERNQFTMIPEVGFTVGVRARDCLHATIGYTVMYFPNVVRAGDQIDRDVNPNLFPPEAVPFSGALRPSFQFVETAYWAHGLNLGAELRF